jgi:Phytanoyl-CoA dioxygenase (PhyH)
MSFRSDGSLAKDRHQDSSYWPLSHSKTVTAWLAIDDADVENACMRFIPGSHLLGHLTHTLSENDETNVLNQTVTGVVRKYSMSTSLETCYVRLTRVLTLLRDQRHRIIPDHKCLKSALNEVVMHTVSVSSEISQATGHNFYELLRRRGHGETVFDAFDLLWLEIITVAQ